MKCQCGHCRNCQRHRRAQARRARGLDSPRAARRGPAANERFIAAVVPTAADRALIDALGGDDHEVTDALAAYKESR